MDNGKPLQEAKNDVDDTVACFQFYANQAIELDKKQDQLIPCADPRFNIEVRYDPVGVTGLIVPWNYPLLMAAWKVAPMLAAGCTAVLKPSELTPLTALELGAICKAVGLPAGVLNVITGSNLELRVLFNSKIKELDQMLVLHLVFILMLKRLLSLVVLLLVLRLLMLVQIRLREYR